MSLQADLKELYARDQRLNALRSRLDSAIRRRDLQNRKLDQLRQQHSEIDDQVKSLRADLHSMEVDTDAADRKLAEYSERMNAVTNNKEFSALSAEANQLKELKAKFDDKSLAQLQRIEGFEEEAGGISAKMDDQQKLIDLTSAEVTEAESEIGDQLAEVEKERDEAAAQIPDAVLRKYRQLMADNDNEALAGIEEQDKKRREYTCLGCYMALPVEHVNRVITRPDELTQCSACHRILVDTQEIAESLAPS